MAIRGASTGSPVPMADDAWFVRNGDASSGVNGRKTTTRKATPVRGDALTPQQQAASSLRYRIFREGRAAGWSVEEIDRRCQQAGV